MLGWNLGLWMCWANVCRKLAFCSHQVHCSSHWKGVSTLRTFPLIVPLLLLARPLSTASSMAGSCLWSQTALSDWMHFHPLPGLSVELWGGCTSTLQRQRGGTLSPIEWLSVLGGHILIKAQALGERAIYCHFTIKETDIQNLKLLTHAYTVEPCSRDSENVLLSP